jgi:heme exporter protein C
MIWKFLLFFWMAVIFILAVLAPVPYIPALGDRARVLFFHVPMAWVSVVAFFMSMFYSIKYITKKEILYDFKASSSAGLGLLFCILATVTGSVWARFNWGAFWNWDPRQTSIFVLLLIYGAYFALRSAVPSEDSRAKLSAVYSILAFVTVPFFIFVVPRIVSSLHPDPIINMRGKINMDTQMLLIFLGSVAGFVALFFWMLNIRIRLCKVLLSKKV